MIARHLRSCMECIRIACIAVRNSQHLQDIMKSSLALRSLALAGLAIFHPHGASANVRLPAIFSDHAVLLSDAAVPVWGWADAGEKVEVSIAGQTKSATPGADGKWTV